jgi:hypothetical protein
MKITSINKPMKRCTMWWGEATEGEKNYHWFFTPRRFLQLQVQDEVNPRCWMNIEPPDGARHIVLKAIRVAKAA